MIQGVSQETRCQLQRGRPTLAPTASRRSQRVNPLKNWEEAAGRLGPEWQVRKKTKLKGTGTKDMIYERLPSEAWPAYLGFDSKPTRKIWLSEGIIRWLQQTSWTHCKNCQLGRGRPTLISTVNRRLKHGCCKVPLVGCNGPPKDVDAWPGGLGPHGKQKIPKSPRLGSPPSQPHVRGTSLSPSLFLSLPPLSPSLFFCFLSLSLSLSL